MFLVGNNMPTNPEYFSPRATLLKLAVVLTEKNGDFIYSAIL